MKITKLGLLSVAVIAAVAGGIIVSLPKVEAYRGDFTQVGPYHTEEREDTLEKIMKSKDFAAWKKVMTENGRNPGVLRVVDTQAEFDKFAQAWLLTKDGKFAEAQKLRAELGLGNGSGNGMRRGGFVDTNNNGICDRQE